MNVLRRVCLALLLMASTASAVGAQSPLASDHAVDIDVTTTWTDTGILVSPGDTLIITAMGTVSDGDGAWDGWFGPEGMTRGPAGGCTTCPLVGYPNGALIARVGAGTPFYVGPFLSVVCETSGVLYLGVNDDAPGSYTGTLRAFIWGGATSIVACDPGICTSPTSLGQVSGDTGAGVLSHMDGEAGWFRVFVTENNGAFCQPMDLTARIRLTPPPGANYDLYVYCDDCLGLVTSSTQPGSAVDEVAMRWKEQTNAGCPTGSDSSRFLYIHVACTSVAVQGDWQLQVFGHSGIGPDTCGSK